MTDQEHGLKRELTARQMAMVAVGGSIGTGLLLDSGAAIQVAGPAVVLTFILSALISWTVAMALGEMSAVHPAAGSFGVYAYLYIINAALVGGMIAWLVSLLAHVRFRRVVSVSQLAEIGMRSPLGGVGSILGFIAIVAAIACTWWVSQSSVAAKSAGIYLVVLTVAYLVVRKKENRENSR